MPNLEVPPFAHSLGNEMPLSFLQAAYLIDGVVASFRQPLRDLSPETLLAAANANNAEAAKAVVTVKEKKASGG